MEYLCKFSGRSYLHLWWLLFEEVELFFPEGYQNFHRIQTFDRKMRREGYQDIEDVDELEAGKITVEKILNHKVDPMDHLDQAIETRRAQVPSKTRFPRVTDAFLIEHADTVHERMSALVKKLSNEHGGDLFRQPVDTKYVFILTRYHFSQYSPSILQPRHRLPPNHSQSNGSRDNWLSSCPGELLYRSICLRSVRFRRPTHFRQLHAIQRRKIRYLDHCVAIIKVF